MTLRTEEDTLIWRRRLWNAVCGGIALEEVLNLPSDRLLDNDEKTFRHNVSVASSNVTLSKNAGSTSVRSYTVKAAGGDWLSQNMTLANRVSGACWGNGRSRIAWHSKMTPIGYPETSVSTELRIVKSQKGADLVYSAAEAWSYANKCRQQKIYQNTAKIKYHAHKTASRQTILC